MTQIILLDGSQSVQDKLAFMNQKNKTMVIAAGGKGKRLKDHFAEVGYSGTKILYPVYGKPLLQHVIETALTAGMKRIFILTKHDTESVTRFLQDKYHYDNRVVVRTSAQDTTISAELLSLEEELAEPFVYADGNILYSPSLLRSLINQESLSLATIAIIEKDYAPTHLSVLMANNGTISNIGTRLSQAAHLRNGDEHQYCSLGVMRFHPGIFDILKQHRSISDLDYLIEYLYNSKELKKELSTFIYDGEWSGLHVEEDIKKMEEYVKTYF